MPEDRDAIYQLAYDEAKQAVAQQVGALDNLRGRAGTLLAVASLSTSFLGGIVLQDKAPEGWLSWAAIGAFLGAVAITLVLLLPRPGWLFGTSAKVIIEQYAEGEHPRGQECETAQSSVLAVHRRKRPARRGDPSMARRPHQEIAMANEQGSDGQVSEQSEPLPPPPPPPPLPDPLPPLPDPLPPDPGKMSWKAATMAGAEGADQASGPPETPPPPPPPLSDPPDPPDPGKESWRTARPSKGWRVR
jgi:hypothetical protein